MASVVALSGPLSSVKQPCLQVSQYSCQNPRMAPSRLGFIRSPVPNRRIFVSFSIPSGLEKQVETAIESAKETCAENAESGECAAAWDEVEELSAAVSHKKLVEKENSDPLEQYCKDNPETDECRTYED